MVGENARAVFGAFIPRDKFPPPATLRQRGALHAVHVKV